MDDEEEYVQPEPMDPEDDEYEPVTPAPAAEDSMQDLEDLAAQYGIPGPREAYAQLSKSAETARSNLRQARARILERKYNKALPLLAASAALGAPTRTGSMGETFSNLSSSLMGPLREQQTFERQRDVDLAGVDTQISGIDERMAMNSLKLAQLMKKSTAAGHKPSAVTVFETLRDLDPEGFAKMTPKERQSLMLESMRNPNLWTGRVNEAVVSVDPTGRRDTRQYSTTESEIDAARRLAGAKAEETDIGKGVAQAKLDLPNAEAAANRISEMLDKIKTHPGKKWVVGWPKNANLGMVARTSARGFQARMDQLQGNVFLDAYQSLMKAGAITDIEGEKATKARARMDTAQTTEDFDEAVDDYLDVVRQGVENLRKRARMGESTEGGVTTPKTQPSGIPTVTSDEDYNALKSGTVFVDPNGVKRKKP